MKKNIVILGALVFCVCSSAYAQESVQVAESIANRFEREYPGAVNVDWKKTDNATVAQFSYHNNFWIAYYKGDGERVASGRKIAELDQLPLKVQLGIHKAIANLEKKFGALQASYAIEIIKEGATRYYLAMENGRVSLVLSADNSGDVVITKKHMKPGPPSRNAELFAKSE